MIYSLVYCIIAYSFRHRTLFLSISWTYNHSHVVCYNAEHLYGWTVTRRFSLLLGRDAWVWGIGAPPKGMNGTVHWKQSSWRDKKLHKHYGRFILYPIFIELLFRWHRTVSKWELSVRKCPVNRSCNTRQPETIRTLSSLMKTDSLVRHRSRRF